MGIEQSLAEHFFEAFRTVWSDAIHRRELRQRIEDAYLENASWTSLLFGTTRSVDLRDEASGEHADWSLFPEVARWLCRHVEHLGLGHARREDYSVDLSLVGGEELIEKRGFGYASRQIVLIEHENDVGSVDEEMFKLLFRVADLKVLAFPDWAERYVDDHKRSPGRNALTRLAAMANRVRRHHDDGQVDNFLVLVAQRKRGDSGPSWHAHFGPWTEMDFDNGGKKLPWDTGAD